MNNRILKIQWERFMEHVQLDVPTATRLLRPYTDAMIDRLTLLSEGCANTNYKVTFKNLRSAVVIRIYVREKTALSHEVNIHQLVKSLVPAPQYLYVDSSCSNFSHPYAILDFMEGVSMREVVLTNQDSAISQCAFAAGQYLNKLRKLHFPIGGFFQEDMTIRPFSHDERYLPFVKMLLEDEVVKESLGQELRTAVSEFVDLNKSFLPNENNANLTHADYDPANMLVVQENGQWKISAILDWEFSFSSTYLLDMGMMLRYSHKLPPCYEESFIIGIQDDGFKLPPQWKKQAKLMDLLCLLNLVRYNPPQQRPLLNQDVVSLIIYTLNNWENF